MCRPRACARGSGRESPRSSVKRRTCWSHRPHRRRPPRSAPPWTTQIGGARPIISNLECRGERGLGVNIATAGRNPLQLPPRAVRICSSPLLMCHGSTSENRPSAKWSWPSAEGVARGNEHNAKHALAASIFLDDGSVKGPRADGNAVELGGTPAHVFDVQYSGSSERKTRPAPNRSTSA